MMSQSTLSCPKMLRMLLSLLLVEVNKSGIVLICIVYLIMW
jgi:hypothetical protein